MIVFGAIDSAGRHLGKSEIRKRKHGSFSIRSFANAIQQVEKLEE
jgi:hypothetical protein